MAMRKFSIRVLSVIAGLILGQVCQAGDEEPGIVDSVETIGSGRPDDSTTLDSLRPADAVQVGDTLLSDTLTEAQRMYREFEERYRQNQETQQAESRKRFSYQDTLINHFIYSRLNRRELIDRSFFHDPGDYFKSNPSYFVLDHQVTPMRKTVQPFGLSGDRLSLIPNGRPIQPFEHIPEPDGLVDLNDMPSALDQDVFLLSGPVGRLFGGRSSVATLLTRSRNPESYAPESAFIVDKGFYGYSYARGRYSKEFADGREIDLSIGYRKSDGPFISYFDDSYHYTGDVYYPLRGAVALQISGQLYDRDGRLAIRPQGGGTLQARDRFDRSLRIALVRHNSDYSAKNEVGYRHLRQASFLTQRYVANFDLTGNGGFVAREWIRDYMVFKAVLEIDHLEYKFGPDNEIADRYSRALQASAARLGERSRWAVQIGQEYVEGFKVLPSITAVFETEKEKFFLLASGGFSERAPSLHELNLPYQEAPIYGGGEIYADQGNSDLSVEKQLIGSLDLQIGRPDNRLGLELTGGRVFDGIDWRNDHRDSLTVFSPVNGDIDFLTVTGSSSIRIVDFLRFHGGASYHYLEYENFDDKPYAPDYQLFSGAELHLFWPQKLIDLYAYGEISYTGKYTGYSGKQLGLDPVLNAKLSFKMGSFRFHYVFQNLLGRVYQAREYFENLGRCNYWGFTWDFLN